MKAARTASATVLVAAVLTATLAGCTPTVAMKAADDATDPGCAAVVVQLPATVSQSGLARRQTDAQGTGAWGDPAGVLLRCGVPVPDPTSTLACVTVQGVDWLRDTSIAPDTEFITYGRSPAISVVVGSAVDGNSTLTDLAPAIEAVPAKHHCVDPFETLQDGVPVQPTTTPTASPGPSASP